MVVTKGMLNGVKTTVTSIYALNEGQTIFLEEAFQKVLTFAEGFLICAGDFNYVSDLRMDRTHKKGLNGLIHSHIYIRLHTLFETFNLTDCWRHANPNDKDFSFYSSRHDVHTRVYLDSEIRL